MTMRTILGTTADQINNLNQTAQAWIAKVKAVGVNATYNSPTGNSAVAGSAQVQSAITAANSAGQSALQAAQQATAYGLTTQATAAQQAGQAAVTIAQQGSALAAGSDATAWLQQATAATQAANAASLAVQQALGGGTAMPGTTGGTSFNPGVASDGGSMPTSPGFDSGDASSSYTPGGYPDPFADEEMYPSQSSAVQRFRETGEDPFDDQGGGGYADAGYSDEGAYAEEDPFADAGAVAQEDPFASTDEYAEEDGYPSQSSALSLEEMKDVLDHEDPTVLGAEVVSMPNHRYSAGLDILGMMSRTAKPGLVFSRPPAAKLSTASTPVAKATPISLPIPPPVSTGSHDSPPIRPSKPTPNDDNLPSSPVSSTPASASTPAPTVSTPSIDPVASTPPPSTASSSSSFDPSAMDMTPGGSGAGGGSRGGDAFDEEAMSMADEESEYEPGDPDALENMVESGDFDAEQLAEEEDVLGVEFKWYDILHPAGYAWRAYQASDTPGATQTGKTPYGKVVRGQPSPDVAARLIASKAKLAALQQLAAQKSQQILQSQLVSAGRSPTSATTALSAPAVDSSDPFFDAASTDAAVVTNDDGTESIVGMDELVEMLEGGLL